MQPRPFTVAFTLLLLATTGCATSARAPGTTPGVAKPGDAPPTAACPLRTEPVEVVESVPVETALDHPCIRNTREVWLELLANARTSVDLASFYAASEAGQPLEAVVTALADAARRVRVRVLLDHKLATTYADTLAALRAAGVEVRTLDAARTLGGVMHAKYMVIDGRRLFVGSQNFDWRALAHIQELGLNVDDAGVAGQLTRVFELDWRLAGGETQPPAGPEAETPMAPVRLFASPHGWLPDGVPWDEPELVKLLDGARTSLRLQLLTYGTGRRGEPYTTLADALMRAARRGVRVRVLLSDWSKRPALIGAVKDLARTPGIEVRMITVPEHSTGFIDFARVAHAKYLVVDDDTAWVGTSNWERDYFYRSRNVAVVVQGLRAVADAALVFDSTWASPYAYAIDPAANYEPPVISRQGR